MVITLNKNNIYNYSDDDALKVQSVLDAIQLFHSYHLKVINKSTTSPVAKNETTDPAETKK